MAGIVEYIKEAKHELLEKVTWPTWKELQTSAVIVLVTSILLSLVVWLMDFVFGIWPNETGFWKGLLGFYYEMFSK